MNKFYFSQQNDPKNWSATGKSIWVGHPAIARTIIRFLAWINRITR